MSDDILVKVEAALKVLTELDAIQSGTCSRHWVPAQAYTGSVLHTDPRVYAEVTWDDIRALAIGCKRSEARVAAICAVVSASLGPDWVITPDNVVDTIEGVLQADFVRYTKAENAVEQSAYYEMELFGIAQVLGGLDKKEYDLLSQRGNVKRLKAERDQLAAELAVAERARNYYMQESSQEHNDHHRTAAELAEFKSWHDKRVEWLMNCVDAEREAHARTRAELLQADAANRELSTALSIGYEGCKAAHTADIGHERQRADRAEGVLRELRAWLEVWNSQVGPRDVLAKLDELEKREPSDFDVAFPGRCEPSKHCPACTCERARFAAQRAETGRTGGDPC